MTDKHNTSLSSYQSAILYELDISQWRLTETFAVAQVEASPLQAASAPVEDQSPKVSKPAVEVMSIPQQVLLLMSANDANDPVVKDILLSLNMDQHEQVLASPEQLENYSDYQLAWVLKQDAKHIEIQWHDNCLFTPTLDSFHNSECKKQLWLVLQKHHDNAVC